MIIVNLDVMLARRKMSLTELAEKLAGKSPFKGVSPINAFTTLFPNTDK